MIDGQKVVITGVAGNTSANGEYFVKVLSSTTFALYTDAALTIPQPGNGSYTGGGIWKTPIEIVASIGNQNGSLKPQLSYGVPNLKAALSSFKDFSVTDLVQVIQRVVDLLQSSDIQGLNTPIPVINQTPNQILNVVDGLAKAAEELLTGRMRSC